MAHFMRQVRDFFLEAKTYYERSGVSNEYSPAAVLYLLRRKKETCKQIFQKW